MVPLTSDLNETPSSSGPLTPLSIAAGTVVLGQIVCCAAALPEHARTSNRPNSAGPACFNNLRYECIKRLCILVFKRIPPRGQLEACVSVGLEGWASKRKLEGAGR